MSPPPFTVNAKKAAATNTKTNPTDNGCTCGQCKLGEWLSPRMLYQLQTQAHHATDAMSKALELEPLLNINLLPYSNFIPPTIYARHLHRAFYRGFISIFLTAHELLVRSPTSMINAEILKAHAPRNSETAYFFSKGGKAEHVLDAIIYNAEERAEEDEYYRQLPPCQHDQDFTIVRLNMGLSGSPYYHVECDGEDCGDVKAGRIDIDVKPSDVPYKHEDWELGDAIDWGEGMSATEMEASDRALHELNKFLQRLGVLSGV